MEFIKVEINLSGNSFKLKFMYYCLHGGEKIFVAKYYFERGFFYFFERGFLFFKKKYHFKKNILQKEFFWQNIILNSDFYFSYLIFFLFKKKIRKII